MLAYTCSAGLLDGARQEPGLVGDPYSVTTGAVVSIVTTRAPEASDTLPATSVARAVMLWAPAPRVETEIVYLPPDRRPAADLYSAGVASLRWHPDLRCR